MLFEPSDVASVLLDKYVLIAYVEVSTQIKPFPRVPNQSSPFLSNTILYASSCSICFIFFESMCFNKAKDFELKT